MKNKWPYLYLVYNCNIFNTLKLHVLSLWLENAILLQDYT